MSDWPPPAPHQTLTTGAFLNPSSGRVGTRLLPPNSPLQHLNSNGVVRTPPHSTNGYGYGTQTTLMINGVNNYGTQANGNAHYGYQYGPGIPDGSYGTTLSPQPHQINTQPYLLSTQPQLASSQPPSPGFGVYGGGRPMRTDSSSNATSVFDMIARSQLRHNGSTKGRRASSANRHANKSLVGQLTALSNSVSKNKLKEENQMMCLSDYYNHTSSYGSIFTQMREINRESRGECEFLAKSLRILRSTAVMTILLVVVLLMPIGMVILGVKYLHGCPKEPFLPIYLLVGGCFAMLRMFTVLWRQLRERKNSDSFDSLDGENQSDFISDRSTQFTDMVLSLFLLAWFGFGNYLTWNIFLPNFTQQLHTPSDWCEKSLYVFCMAQIITCYSVFVLFLCVLGCLCCARHICCFDDKYKPVTR